MVSFRTSTSKGRLRLSQSVGQTNSIAPFRHTVQLIAKGLEMSQKGYISQENWIDVHRCRLFFNLVEKTRLQWKNLISKWTQKSLQDKLLISRTHGFNIILEQIDGQAWLCVDIWNVLRSYLNHPAFRVRNPCVCVISIVFMFSQFPEFPFSVSLAAIRTSVHCSKFVGRKLSLPLLLIQTQFFSVFTFIRQNPSHKQPVGCAVLVRNDPSQEV